MAKRKPTQKKEAKSKNWLENNLRIGVIILVATFLLYGNTLSHQFTQDDSIVIIENEFTLKGISGITDILKYDTFRGFFKEAGKENLVSGGRYRPFTLVMFATELQFFGNSPFAGHLFNLIYFALCSFVLFLFLKNILIKKYKNIAHVLAFGATLLFLAHPVHVEAVANIKGRDEIMVLLLSLLSALLTWKAYHSGNNKQLLLGALAFLFAIFSKENAITFLAIIPLSLFLFADAKLKKIISVMLPIVGATIIFLIVRTLVIGASFGDAPLELMNNPFVKLQGNKWVYFTFAEKMATIFATLYEYIRILFYPMPLTHDYYPRYFEVGSFGDIKTILGLLLNGGLLIFSILKIKSKPIISFSILFYLITLFIVSNIVFPVGTNMAERFIFMPSLGFVLIIAYLIILLLKKLGSYNSVKFFGIISILFVLLGFTTIRRNKVWKDNYTLFTTDIKTSKNSAKLNNAVGGELIAKSIELEGTKKDEMLNRAINHLKTAQKIHPTYRNAYLLEGNAYNNLKQFDKAIEVYNKALKLSPGYQDAINNRGITSRMAGRYWGQEKGNLKKSIEYLKKAEKDLGQDIETYRLLGVAYGMQSNFDNAVRYFEKCNQLNPKIPGIWLNLGNTFAMQGDLNKAISAFKKCTELEPQNANNWVVLGNTYEKNGNQIEAQAAYKKARELKGGN